jgi:hydroxymethylpyrimidine/phosphomethylpyrimidine kinase
MDRSPRLAELVVHLTGCSPAVAVAAVAAATAAVPRTADDALDIVARAICSIRHLDLTDPVDLRDPSEVHVQ